MANQRIVFSFDDRSIDNLKAMQEEGGFTSMANVIRESLMITRNLQKQAEQGYTEIVVRNPGNGHERVLVVPNLASDKK